MKKAARFTITGTAWFESYRREVYNLPSKAEKPWPALLRDNQRHVVLFFFFFVFCGAAQYNPHSVCEVCRFLHDRVEDVFSRYLVKVQCLFLVFVKKRRWEGALLCIYFA